ncbi:MAG: translocation/assembly module TamB, partial [Bdellovibrionales bacterium]|nr:translocation/assembly module TamB [Bdellovibrionales bacterium]
EKFSSGEISLLGTALKLKFNNTFGSKGSTDIDLKTDKWNIAQTFSIFSESLRSGSYQTNLSSELHVVIPNSAPLNFDAEFSATELFLRNGKTEMTIDKPLKLSAKNGIIKAENFEIIGENTFIRLKSTNKTKQELALTLDGRLDLSLASLLTPFLDDLKGLLRFSFSLDGTYQHPTLSGSAFIEDGLVKIKGFPHALEQISADVILNNENIIINSAKGKVGGGQFNAGGRVSARSIGNVPVDIKGIFYDSSFNVPEGFSTRGSGELFVRGAWFPYTVGVNFNVDSGSVEMRTLDNSKSTPGIKPSSYLPKSISARQFSPVDLALDINIRRALPIKISISRVDIRSEALGRMKIEGPPQNPLLTGKINIVRGGKISFRNNIFEIKNGTVEYDKAVPSNPTLNIQADARVTAQLKNNETRDYDIDMRVQGTATNPKITLASQPALPENDLISLLTLGFINEESSAADTTREGLIANTSSQLLSAVVTEQLDRVLELNSKFGMQLDINSSYDSEDKAEKHKVTIRKQITPKFGASASREIGKTTTNNVKAEYKLNKNLSVIGEWEGKEPTTSEQSTQSAKDLNIFGLDIEYKVDFK